MATKFTIENAFPEISVSKFEKYLNHPRLNNMLSDMPAFRSRDLVDETVNDNGDVQWRFKVVAGGNIPPAAAKVVSEDMLTWYETSTFRAKDHCIEWQIEPVQKTIKFEGFGTWQLNKSSNGKGTDRVIAGEIKVGIPFVGKMVEGFIVNELKRNYEVEPQIQEDFYASMN